MKRSEFLVKVSELAEHRWWTSRLRRVTPDIRRLDVKERFIALAVAKMSRFKETK